MQARFQHAQRTGSGRRSLTVKAAGKPNGGGSPLILPGSPRQDPRSGGRPANLIIPGQGRPSQQQNKPGLPGRLHDADLGNIITPGVQGIVSETAPILNRFRPPAGFMDDTVADDDDMADIDPQQMLQRIQGEAGHWYDLAKLIPRLQGKGFDSSAIAEITGITSAIQNSWVVAGTVHKSLVQSGKLSQEVLEHFDGEGNELLYPLSSLSIEKRIAAALYIREKNLDPPACKILARAMKEWERRPEERVGFADTPGDCLAFKLLRDARECRNKEEAAQKVAEGLKMAETDGARKRLEALIAEAESPAPVSRANLTILRLAADELGYRPLPQIAPLGEATASELAAAPRATQEGVFGSFTLINSGEGQRWLALPQWKAMQFAVAPVALPVAECSEQTGIIAASNAKTKDDIKRLKGPGLVVVDLDVGEISEEQFYLVPDSTGKLQLVDGARATEGASAVVLFLCRPPIRDAIVPTPDGQLQL